MQLEPLRVFNRKMSRAGKPPGKPVTMGRGISSVSTQACQALQSLYVVYVKNILNPFLGSIGFTNLLAAQ